MKRTGIQHNQLAQLVARMGHGDMMLIGDVGCPFPRSEGTVAIDLAIVDGIPKVEDVLKAVLGELVVESYIVSQETKDNNPTHYKTFKQILGTFDNKGNAIAEKTLPHLAVKDLWVNGATKGEQMRVFVRTAERSPYAYIILVAGVDF
jgi:D-ribose pyranase